MKPKKIEWSNAIFDLNQSYELGLINKKIWFEVRKIGKITPFFILLTYPISNDYFIRANNTKKIDTFDTIELAKEKAQEIFDELVNSLIEE